jgi:lysophospholipase L1-like esterase
MILSALLLAGPSFDQSLLPPIFAPHETILFQGDSITDGNRGRNADPNHILGHGYVFSIASQYGEAYPSLDLNFVNRGISGNKLSDLVARWQPDTIDLKPDVLSILIGINDILAARPDLHNFSTANLFATYDNLLSETVQARPGIKLILCEPFVLDVGMVMNDPSGWHEAVAKMDAMVETLGAKYHAPVVHFQRAFNDTLLRAPANHWIWDGIHPTYSGHALMANQWIRAYNDFYISPLNDPLRNSALLPQVNTERDSYDWLHRHDDVLDTQKAADPDVVMVGDSITNFWGGNPKANRASGQAAWDQTFRGVRVLNMGFGWDRTQNVLWRLNHGEMSDVHPKTVVLNIGTNNLVGDQTARENTPEETAAGVTAVVDALRSKAPQAQIVVMGIFPRGFERGNDLDRRIREVNKILARSLAGKAGVSFLEIGDQLREADGSVSPKILSDGTHPTELGYEIWGRALVKTGTIPGRSG